MNFGGSKARAHLDDVACLSIKVQHVHDKLQDCKGVIDRTTREINEKFPKSIFDNLDKQEPVRADSNPYDTSGNGEENQSVESDELTVTDEKLSDQADNASSVPGGDSNTSSLESPAKTVSGPQADETGASNSTSNNSSAPVTGRRSKLKHEVMKLFKITTGSNETSKSSASRQNGSGGQNGLPNESIPIVTSIPFTANHCFLSLLQLEVPKVLGTVSAIGVNSEGHIAGGTVHGEIFLYNVVPYSRRSPNSVTRGHEGGVVSLTWMSSSLRGGGLHSYFVTTGTDRKILLWQSLDETAGLDGPVVDIKANSVATCCCIHPVNQDVLIFGFIDHSVAMYRILSTQTTISSHELESGAPMVKLSPISFSTKSSLLNKPVTAVSVSPDGKKLAMGSATGTVGFVDLSTMSLDVEVDCRNRTGATSGGRKITGLHWSSDSACVLVSSCDSRIRIVQISDLSRRTKFKSNHYLNENLFLGARFGVPDEDRIIAVSENGTICIWQLHTSSDTNENCSTCNILDSKNKFITKPAASSSRDQVANAAIDITASVVIPATHPFCHAIQKKVVDLGQNAFNPSSGFFLITCDSSGCIRVFAELFTPV